MLAKIKSFAVIFLVLFVLLLSYFSLRAPVPYTKTEFLMDTVMKVTVYDHGAGSAVEKVFSRLRALDEMLSVHKEDSRMTMLNNAPAGQAVAVDGDMIEILNKSKQFSTLTKGAVDVTLLPVTRLWGFGTEHASVPTDEEIQNAILQSGMEKFMVDEESSTIIKLTDTLQFDLGAVAKGYAVDVATRMLQAEGIRHACLDFGGNVSVFGGVPLSPFKRLTTGASTRPYTIGIQKPGATRGEIIETVTLTDGFVVTSGDYERYFTEGEKEYHHILDPKTGSPADSGYKSVTVICNSGTDADLLSTAIFVGGKNLAEELSPYYRQVILIDKNLGVSTLSAD